MSCWMLNDEVISRIAVFLKYEQGKFGPRHAVVPICHLSEQKIGEKLRAMNVKAYNQRYDGRYSKDCKKFVYVEKREPVSLIQHLKDLHCYHYQCCEGNVPKMKLYKQLDRLISSVEAHIVHQLPEYDKATWGE